MVKLTQFQASIVNAVASTFYMFTFGLIVSLLVFYLMNQIGMSREAAYCYFSAFLSLFFCLAIAGGYIGQKQGFRNSVIISGIFMPIGLLLVSIFGYLTLGLSLYVVGCGFFIPNKAVCVSQVFNSNDNKRSIAFTLSYFLMNIGAMFGGLFSGSIVDRFGYGGVFALAALGVLIASQLFSVLSHKFPFVNGSQCELQEESDKKKIFNLIMVFISGLILALLSFCLLSHPEFDRAIIIMMAISIISYLLYVSFFSDELVNNEQENIRKFLLMSSLLILFWSLYDLEPTALLIFIKTHVNRVIFHHVVPASDFFCLDPAMVFIVGLMVYLFFKESVIYKMKTLYKLLIGVFFSGLALVTLFYITNIAQHHLISIWWVILVYFLISCGEILVGPSSSAMVGELGPKQLQGILMGFGRFVSGFSAIISGYLAISTVNTLSLFNHKMVGFHYLLYSLVVFAFLLIFISYQYRLEIK
ncbi:MAG: oligopeptide:H+ symporter [Legionellales bacterium]|nr:oligopeptide:H+ symporter [Legionellales bacterium]